MLRTFCAAAILAFAWPALIYAIPARAGVPWDRCCGLLIRRREPQPHRLGAALHRSGIAGRPQEPAVRRTGLRLTYRRRPVVVLVQDRGPYLAGRTLDLSQAVAKRLGTLGAGVARICVQRVS